VNDQRAEKLFLVSTNDALEIKRTKQIPSLFNAEKDTYLRVFSFLSEADVLKARLVCKKWKTFVACYINEIILVSLEKQRLVYNLQIDELNSYMQEFELNNFKNQKIQLSKVDRMLARRIASMPVPPRGCVLVCNLLTLLLRDDPNLIEREIRDTRKCVPFFDMDFNSGEVRERFRPSVVARLKKIIQDNQTFLSEEHLKSQLGYPGFAKIICWIQAWIASVNGSGQIEGGIAQVMELINKVDANGRRLSKLSGVTY
jgi:hypothetical protein